MTTMTIPRADQYAWVFERACELVYPAVDAFAERCDAALDRWIFDQAARTLACPLKANPPHWQHGRVLYAAARRALRGRRDRVLLLDIGTAKGFSALCLQWALNDSEVDGQVVSVDVIDPRSREARNSVAECDGPKTLTELHRPWPELGAVRFLQSTGVAWLEHYTARIAVAFVDGKHAAETVRREAGLLTDRQQSGDVSVFDDLQIPAVAQGLAGALDGYEVEQIEAGPRTYAVAVRR